MSTTSTLSPIARPDPTEGAATDVAASAERRFAEYRVRVELLRRGYRRRARYYGVAANAVSLLLVAAGAAVGLSPLAGEAEELTVVLGVAVILLEGVTRVLRPASRASRARRVTQRLDREFRLYDAHGRGYRTSGPDCDAAFVAAVERILEQAAAAEEHDETGSTKVSAPSRKTT